MSLILTGLKRDIAAKEKTLTRLKGKSFFSCLQEINELKEKLKRVKCLISYKPPKAS